MNYLSIILLFFLNSVAYAQSSDYPGRNTYPKVNIYTTEQLNQSIDDAIIIDARSAYEFDVLHINGAINIPLNSPQFVNQLKELDHKNKPLVFYCNGHSCFKSYKAVIKAKKAGINNTFSYDSGIFDWANAHPEKSTLLNVSPINPDNILSKAILKKHTLSPKDFMDKITDNSIILDIRDPAQRGLLSLFPYRQKNISLQQRARLSKLLDKVLKNKAPLFIYDATGKQIRWFQYHIEAKGIKNYFFMEGGSKNFLRNN